MESPKITIIIAVYNTEKYLHKCINSIVKQSYHNLEIILVDDGSTDSCAVICNDFAKSDNRIKVLHQTNGGQGSARNKALDIATGDWIGFVDSDDWIDADMYEFLITSTHSEQAEIVECGWKKITENGEIEFITPPKKLIIDNEQAMHALVYGSGKGINTSVCNKLFKRTIIDLIRFPEVRAYEDDEFIHKVLWNAHKILITGEAKYNYLTRPESTMTAEFNLNKLALITVQENICEFLKENAPQYFNMAQKVLCSKYFYILYMLKYNSNKPQIEIIQATEKKLLALSNEFIRNPLMGANRIMVFVFKLTPNLANHIIKLKFRLHQ